MTDCVFDEAGCLVCPEIEASPGSPARVELETVVGWNAGANSITMLDGDIHTVFPEAFNVAAVVVGLKGSRSRQTVPALIEHGWYFQSLAGVNLAQILESGVAKTALASRLVADTFEIRRQGGTVTYWQNTTLVHTSLVPSTGPKVVNACLYVSGDSVGA